MIMFTLPYSTNQAQFTNILTYLVIYPCPTSRGGKMS